MKNDSISLLLLLFAYIRNFYGCDLMISGIRPVFYVLYFNHTKHHFYNVKEMIKIKTFRLVLCFFFSLFQKAMVTISEYM